MVYKLTEANSNTKFFDLDQPASEQLLNRIQGSTNDDLYSELIEQSIDDAGDNPSLGKVIDEIRANSRTFNVPSYDVVELIENFKDILRKDGYGGFTHVGGNKAGKGKRKHQVRVYWDPASQLQINPASNKIFEQRVLPGSPEDIARQTGKSVDEVRKSLDDKQRIKYTYDKEIHEAAQTVDELVEANKPSKGNDFVNDEALQQKMLGEDRIEYDDTYFSNLEALTSEDSVAVAIARATDGLKRMPKFSEDTAFAMSKASRFLDATLDKLDDNFDEVVDQFFDQMTDPLPRSVNSKTGEFDQASDLQEVWDVGSQVARDDGLIELGLREYRISNVEGMAAGAALVEELGRRLSKQAQVVSALETGNVEFTKAVEDFFKLEDKLNLFAIPLRRAKRQWAITGTLQQREMIEALQDADIFKPGVSKRRKGSYTQDGYQLTKIYKSDVDMEGYTSRELWERFKSGNKEAGDTLKLYIHTVAYGNSRTMLTEIDNLDKILKEQLRKGNADAGRNLMYQYWLSRLAPQTASIASNIFNSGVMPIGTALMGEKAYSRGMIVGSVTSISEAFQNAAKAWKRGQGMFGSSKFDNDAKALSVRRANEEKLWKGTQKIMNREGANGAQKAAAFLNHVRRKFSMMPGMDFAIRGLSAGDDFFNTITASQIATGRAYKEAADTDNWKDLDRLVKQHFKNVFRGGVATGKIIDPEVIEASRYITFQRDIPVADDANQVDKAFRWLGVASSGSSFFNYLSPFTRLTWNTLRLAVRSLLVHWIRSALFPVLLPRISPNTNLEPGCSAVSIVLRRHLLVSWVKLLRCNCKPIWPLLSIGQLLLVD